MLAGLLVLVSAAAGLAQSPGSADKPNSTIPEKQHMGPVNPGEADVTGGVIAPRGHAGRPARFGGEVITAALQAAVPKRS